MEKYTCSFSAACAAFFDSPLSRACRWALVRRGGLRGVLICVNLSAAASQDNRAVPPDGFAPPPFSRPWVSDNPRGNNSPYARTARSPCRNMAHNALHFELPESVRFCSSSSPLSQALWPYFLSPPSSSCLSRHCNNLMSQSPHILNNPHCPRKTFSVCP
jgi:hypothetical protein